MYNTEAFINDCLDSLVAQTFTDFEAIIINDGSTDESARIAASYASSDARFRLIGQPNKGPSEARNTGLKIMRGDYVTFIDSDDCVAPNYLETLFFLAQLHQADIVCCSTQNINEAHKIDGSKPNTAIYKMLTAEEAAKISLYQDSLPDYSAWNKLYNLLLQRVELRTILLQLEDVFFKGSHLLLITQHLDHISACDDAQFRIKCLDELHIRVVHPIENNGIYVL